MLIISKFQYVFVFLISLCLFASLVSVQGQVEEDHAEDDYGDEDDYADGDDHADDDDNVDEDDFGDEDDNGGGTGYDEGDTWWYGIGSLLEVPDHLKRKFPGRMCNDLDLHLLVENSVFIDSIELMWIKYSLKALLRKFILSQDDVRVSVSSFAGNSLTLWRVDQMQNWAILDVVIDNLRKLPGRASPKALLATVDNILPPLDKGDDEDDYGRSKRERFNVCLVVSASPFIANLDQAALQMQERCRVISIGTLNAAMRQLYTLSTPPATMHVFINRRVQGIRQEGNLQNIKERICSRYNPLAKPRVVLAIPGQRTVRLEWQHQPSVDTYTIQLLEADEYYGEGTVIVFKQNIEENGITLEDLHPGQLYYATVWGKSDDVPKGPMGRLVFRTDDGQQ